MDKWEYNRFVVKSNDMETFNKYGDEGWEIFHIETASGVSMKIVYAKRKKN